MLEKLAQIEKSYSELNEQLSSPDITSDISSYKKLMKQHRALGEIVEKYREVKKMQDDLDGAKEVLGATEDQEMRELAEMEIAELEEGVKQGEEALKILLIPKDPNDEKNVILEIRAGTGGDEATLFAADMLRMYARFAEKQAWKMDVMNASDTGVGGLKEVFAMIEGLRSDRNPIALRYSSRRRHGRGEFPAEPAA